MSTATASYENSVNEFTRLYRSGEASDEHMWHPLAIQSVIPGMKKGSIVSPVQAMSLSAVYAAVRVITDTISTLALRTYEELDSGKREAVENPAYQVLYKTPNMWMTASVFLQTLVEHVLLWGNGYAEIVWAGNNRVKSLYIIEPWRCRPVIKGSRLYYEVIIVDEYGAPVDTVNLELDDIIHIQAMGLNGIEGKSVVRYAAESLGLSLKAEKFGEAFFRNAARPAGVLEHPAHLGEDAAKTLRRSWQDVYAGSDNTGKVAVLEEGMTFKPMTIPPEEAQFLETRKFQVSEIARWFRVPPHMIGDLERATFSNIEQESLNFLTHTIRPWLVRIEQEFDRKLLGDNLYCKFDTSELLRAETVAMSQAAASGITHGYFNLDEVRDWWGYNPLPDGLGKRHYIQGALQPVDRLDEVIDKQVEPTPEPEPMQEPAEDDQGTDEIRRLAMDGLLAEAQRMVSLEVNSIRRAAKNASALVSWLDEFYGKQQARLKEALTHYSRILGRASGRTDMESVLVQAIQRYTSESREAIIRAAECDPGQLPSVLDQLISRWEIERARDLAREIAGRHKEVQGSM